MSRVLVALDPSYTRTGIAVYCDNKILVGEVRGKEIVQEFSKSFDGIYWDSEKISRAIIVQVKKMIGMFGPEISKGELISECPPPQGQYAPGLYALDIRLFTNFYTDHYDNVYTVYPNYLMHIHGKRNYNKSESVELAQEILKEYDHEILSKRLSHDESEAVIFLSRLLYKNSLLTDRIVNLIPNIKNEKERRFEYI